MHPLKMAGAVACAAAAFLSLATPAAASPISEIRQERDGAQDALYEAENGIEEIRARQEELQEQIDGLDAELTRTMVEIGTTEEDLADRQKDLETAEEALAEARRAEDEHVESMKLRIRYMYENGDMDAMEALLSAGSFADMLSKAENFQAIYEADRELFDGYEEARQRREEAERAVAEETEALEDLKAVLETQKAELESEIEGKSGEIAESDAELEEMEKLAAEYRSTIDDMNDILMSASDENTVVLLDGNAEEMGRELMEYAGQFVGNPYVWGGTSLTDGCDCSGFVKSVYAHYGVSLPHYSGSLRSVGYAVDADEMQPGDIVCYQGHVGLYAGDGKILNASNSKPYPKGGIKYSDVNYRNIVCVRRIFADSPESI